MKYKRFLKLLSLICICFTLFTSTTYAGVNNSSGSNPSKNNSSSTDPNYDVSDINSKDLGAIGDIANIVINIFFAIGVLLLIYSICLFVMANRNDNPEERHKATVMLVVGIIFLGMRSIAIAVVQKTFVAAGYGNFIK